MGAISAGKKYVKKYVLFREIADKIQQEGM